MSGPELGHVLRHLYESKIEFVIVTLKDRGWAVAIGDAANVIEAEETFGPDELDQVASWLIVAACRRYPTSKFATIYG